MGSGFWGFRVSGFRVQGFRVLGFRGQGFGHIPSILESTCCQQENSSSGPASGLCRKA